MEVTFKEKPVGLYAEAILVEDRVVVEFKTVELLAKTHEAQLLNYLKASGERAGLLVNVAHPKRNSGGWFYDFCRSFRVFPWLG